MVTSYKQALLCSSSFSWYHESAPTAQFITNAISVLFLQ